MLFVLYLYIEIKKWINCGEEWKTLPYFKDKIVEFKEINFWAICLDSLSSE